MKKILMALLVLISMAGFAQNETKGQKSNAQKNTKIVLAYVTSGNPVMPDANKVTHINYAFGEVNKTFNGVDIHNPARLHEIVKLKAQNKDLKIMLSIGGWGSGRFSEMAADATTRAAFVADCHRITKEFGIDGIDLDWEYPTSNAADISCSPSDTENFTTLMKDLRKKLGKKQLLTFASAGNAKYVDFKAILPYIDFVNIMSYDMGNPPKYHHSALYPSDKTNNTTSQAVDAHIAAGIPAHMLNLGLPFYGHGNTKKGYSHFVTYKECTKLKPGLVAMWDDTAQVPYVVDEDGDFTYCFDNPKSLAIKCQYAIDKGLLGVMYWAYPSSDEDMELVDTVYYSIYPKK